MRKTGRILLYTLGGILALLLIVVLAVFAVLRTEAGRDWIVATVTDLASTPGEMEVGLAGLDGPLPGSIGLRGFTLADADGVWLSVDSVRLEWNPLSLFSGTVDVDLLGVDGVHVRRLPAGAPAPEEEQPPADLTIPSIPVDIVVRRLAVEDVRLDEPVAGMPVTLRAEGRIAGAEGGAIRSDLTVERTDGDAGKLVLAAGMNPVDRSVTIDAALSEPAGGLIVRSLNVSGLPPVTVRLTGEGPVDAVTGKLTASMGDAIGLDLDYRSSYAPEAAALAVNGTARIEPLLPEQARPAAAGGLVLDLSARLASQTLTLEMLSLASDALSLTADGTAVLDVRTLDMRAGLALKQPELVAAFAPDVAVNALDLRLRADGSFDMPRLDAEISADEISLPAALVEGLTATLRVTPQRPLAEGMAAAFDVAVLANRVAASDAPPEAAGPMFLGVTGAADMDAQRVTLESLNLSHPLAKAEGSATALLEPLEVDGKLALDAPSLAPLSALAGMPLSGAAKLVADATVREGGQSIDAAVDGTVTNLVLPQIPAAAALAGETARLLARIETRADSSHRVDTTLQTAAAQLKIDGTIAPAFDTLELNYGAEMPRLAPFGAVARTELSGSATLSGKVSGAVASPTVTALLEGREVAAAGQPLGAVRAEVRAADVATAAKGNLSFRASPPQGAVQIATDFAMSDSALRLTGTRVGAPGGSIDGQMTVPLDGAPAQGRLAGTFADIGPLLAIAGQQGGGALQLSIDLSGRNGRQAADADLRLSNFRLAGAGEPLQVTSVDLKADAVLAETPRGNVTANLAGLTAGTNKVERLTLSLQGAQTGADFTLATNGEATVPFRIEAGGNVGYADGAATLRLERLNGTLRDERLALRQPMRLVAAPGRIEVADLELALSTGVVRVDAAVSPDRLAADLNIDRLPLALAKLAQPDIRVEGELTGRATLAGSAAAPRGDATLDFSGVRYGGANDMPPVAGRIEANWRDGTLNSTARISGFDGPPIAVDAQVPLRMGPQTTVPFVPPDGPLRASVRWNGEIAPLFLLLPMDGHTLRGRANIDLNVAGTVGAPQASGSVVFENGEYENLLTGTLLDQLSLRAEAAGDRITIRQLSATDGARGTISASGFALADGSQVEVQARVQDAVLVRRDDVTAELDAELAFRRSPQGSEATGTITTETVEIRLVDNLPPGVVDLEVIERGGGRPPPEPDLQPKTPAVDAPDIRLDIDVSMPRRVFVRGRGLDSEWAGSFDIAGTASQPRIRGEIHSVRGSLDLLTRNFEVRPSKIEVSQNTRNEIVAALDISAASDIDELEAIVKIGGTAAAPEIAVTSNPPRPQDEVIALILFGKTTAQLTAFEAVQLAAAVAELTGSGGGGILDFARNAVGVDVLRVGGTDAGDPTVQAGKYIAKDVYVGVEQGTAAGSSAVSVEAEIFPNVSVQSRVRPDGESDVGVKMEWNY